MVSCVPQILQTSLKASHVSTRSSVTKEVLCCALGAKDGTPICGTAQRCSESEKGSFEGLRRQQNISPNGSASHCDATYITPCE